MKWIPLSQGMVTIVDDCDFEFLSQWKWCVNKNAGMWYARRSIYSVGKQRAIFMHRLIAGAVPGQIVDHKDRNSLNNQRSNLRIATVSQNTANSGLMCDNTSGFKGIYRPKGKIRWIAAAQGKSGRKFLGFFNTPEEAARAYDSEAERIYGDFAMTNKKLGLLP